MLKGKSVLLRPVQRADISFFLKWFNDPEVTQYLMMTLPMTEMAEQKFIEELGTVNAANQVIFVVEANNDKNNKPIGSISLSKINNKDHNATFGIAIGEKEYWSRGYGTEAAGLIIKYGFEQLNMHRITSSALSFNERSLRMHRKLGFREEGRSREAIYKNGAYHDEVLFGLLREDWKRMNQP
jgi:RimJ/RimL family protein N-acetyltransferase